MQITSLEINNIRSYKQLTLDFQQGITLLTGDIGSGKSTILLAIEFALFGIIRGALNGNALLRRGQKEGSVLLNFNINNKQVSIQRSLKKIPNGYSQESGFLKVNSKTFEGTASELKAKILELLGYPEDLLTKSKNLIYRYTIYTPQEEMKTIIQETSEQRLEKLRKIFDVDKYKTIKENTSNYAKKLREDMKYLEGRFEGLDEDYKRINELKKENNQLMNEYKKQQLQTIKFEEEHKKAEGELEKYNKQKEKIDALKNEQEKINNKINLIKNNIEQLQNNNDFLIQEIKNLQKTKKPDYKTETHQELKQKYQEIKNKIELLDENINKASNKKAVYQSKIKDLQNEQVTHLEKCPTCKQEVSEQHKKKVSEQVNKQKVELENKLEKYIEYVQKAVQKKNSLTEKQELLTENLQEQELLKQKLQQYQSITNQINLKNEQIKKNKDEIRKYNEDSQQKNKELKELQNKLDEQSFDKTQYELLKQKELVKRKELEQQRMIQVRKEQSIKYQEEKINDLQKQASVKEKQKNLLEQKRTLHNWLVEHFNKLMDLIEKHVLVNIHKEFNEQFKYWFELLLEDQSLTGSLDGSFSPLITQDGYDAEIENLSGGEKTATALAYRLALNKVINDYVSNLKTKELIILDEPTDGFSSDQPDKINEVLPQIDSKQIIMVSHEQKLETMAEHIIKIQKTEHESYVV